jgi:outer membrane protein insertion porin family
MRSLRIFNIVAGLAAACLILAGPARAILLDALDPAKEWRVEKIKIFGNVRIPADTLLDEMLTKERPWYRPWAESPVFDSVTFENDLERLRRFYEARGYYGTQVSYDLDADEGRALVTARIRIVEGAPVVISGIDVRVSGAAGKSKRPSLPETLPVKRGTIFDEEKYQAAEDALRKLFLRNAYAHVEIQRRAELDLIERKVRIEYTIEPGPLCVFGPTEVTGTDKVDPELVRREITYAEGEAFSPEKIAETRAKILGLGLFASVRIGPTNIAGKPSVVPMIIEVREKLHREVKVSVGYSTEDEFLGQLEWRNLNWFGGGRRLSLRAKYSGITSGGAVELVQPHFLLPQMKGTLAFKHDQETEDTYLRNATGFTPRLDVSLTHALTAFLGFRVEFNKLNDINAATVQALGSVRREGIVSGPSAGLVWDTSDDPFAPKRGEVLSFTIQQAGDIWGGPFRFYKMTGEAKKYITLGWETVFASRLKIGLGDAIGADNRFPLFERFFAGGANSVRGYARRRLGPLSSANDPLGGLSLIEGSLELRRPIWRELSGALFVDFGQVSLRSFDVPIDDLQFSPGFGLSYTTPIGPLRLDVGFPIKPPHSDRPWQIHFSIGASF